MKIYFCGSVTGGREFQQNYGELIEFLKTKGTVLTEHLGNKELSDQGEELPAQTVFERDMKWLEEADIVIAEVSVPSLGIGYEIAAAEKQEKKIVALYSNKAPKKLSRIISGNRKIKMVFYEKIEEAKKELEKVLNESQPKK